MEFDRRGSFEFPKVYEHLLFNRHSQIIRSRNSCYGAWLRSHGPTSPDIYLDIDTPLSERRPLVYVGCIESSLGVTGDKSVSLSLGGERKWKPTCSVKRGVSGQGRTNRLGHLFLSLLSDQTPTIGKEDTPSQCTRILSPLPLDSRTLGGSGCGNSFPPTSTRSSWAPGIS